MFSMPCDQIDWEVDSRRFLIGNDLHRAAWHRMRWFSWYCVNYGEARRALLSLSCCSFFLLPRALRSSFRFGEYEDPSLCIVKSLNAGV